MKEVKSMKKRTLGKDLEVSTIGYGAMGLSHAYGEALDKKDAIQLIHDAYDQGYTLFDTASAYVGKYADGSTAINEELVGEAIRPFRNKITLATKGGVSFEGNNLLIDASPKSLRRSVENSLRQLNVDTIDLYYQHMQDPKVEPEVVAETMGELIKEGKIRHWGISNADADYIKRADDVTKVTAVQGKLNMISRQSEELFPMLSERNIGFVAYSPLASGFLTSNSKPILDKNNNLDFRNRMHQYTTDGMDEAKDISQMIAKLAKQKNATSAQISLAWLLKKESWIVPIPGTRKQQRLIDNAQAADIELTDEEENDIDSLLEKVDYEQFENK
ncbi:aldo-keto oxidoreductase [Companilactobacillus alimentarius DSM 20249]|nr:aldo-keto oxidoreductase [Companilactobacillus alimentarius DSM 20249]